MCDVTTGVESSVSGRFPNTGNKYRFLFWKIESLLIIVLFNVKCNRLIINFNSNMVAIDE